MLMVKKTAEKKCKMVKFFVAGRPIPQGSKALGRTKDGRFFVRESNKNLAVWRQRISTEAQKAQEREHFFDEDAIGYIVNLHFHFPRPKSLPKRIKSMVKRPDIDKIQRAVLDGVTGILIADDSQVFAITARKRYAEGEQPPGVEISIRRYYD